MSAVLSIIIPVYNAVQYIEMCVESIFSGASRDLEVLLIDDGSTDASGLLCDQLAKKYSGVRVFHTENRGIAEARNLGLQHAAGQYIGFVDADDTVAPNMFETMLRCMREDIQLVACRFLRCQETDARITDASISAERVVDQAGAMEQLLSGGYGSYAWNKLFRKEVLDANQIQFPRNCRALEDVFFVWEYIQHCEKAVFLDNVLYFYVMHHGSIMNTFRDQRTVSNSYVNLPRSWRYCTETVEKLAPVLQHEPRARTVMFYQTVLRKLADPETEYVQEAIAYVKQNKSALLRYRWGLKYYLSAIVLSISYPLWSAIFRRGVGKHQ